MYRLLKLPWLCAAALTLVLAATAPAQPTAPPTTAPPTSGGTTTGGSSASGGLSGLFGGFGFSFLSAEQDAQALMTAVAVVQEIGQVVPLSTEEQMILVFFIYEIEKLNAIMNMLSGGSMTPMSPAGS